MRILTPLSVGVAVGGLALALAGQAAPRPAPQPPAADTVRIAPGTLSLRPAGEYLRDTRPVDGPRRDIAFADGLEIMRHQVTVRDYARCVAAGACEPAETAPGADGDLPVTGVSFRDAAAYAAWLSATSGDDWRLPTDAEWAFAAAERMNDEGLDGDSSEANPASRWLAKYQKEFAGERAPRPRPVGSFGVNSRGVADMAGNVWDWTSSCYLRASVAADGTILDSIENCGVRVVGGRHRGYMSTFIRDGKSGGCAAGSAPDNLGIRLVREATSAPVAWLRALRRLVG
jgi:formylglycine-generating enzyme required for sulfatase activity